MSTENGGCQANRSNVSDELCPSLFLLFQVTLFLRLISLLTFFSSEENLKSGFWVRGLVWIHPLGVKSPANPLFFVFGFVGAFFGLVIDEVPDETE